MLTLNRSSNFSVEPLIKALQEQNPNADVSNQEQISLASAEKLGYHTLQKKLDSSKQNLVTATKKKLKQEKELTEFQGLIDQGKIYPPFENTKVQNVSKID